MRPWRHIASASPPLHCSPPSERLQKLLQHYGKDHPKVVEVREQMKMIRDRQVKGSREGRGKDSNQRYSGPVAGYVQLLEQELKDIDDWDKDLGKQWELLSNEAKKLTSNDSEHKLLSGEISRAEQFHDALLKQLQGLTKPRFA